MVGAVEEALHFELAWGVARLVLDRPQARNALSVPMRDAMADAVRRIDNDRAIRAVIITGAGGHFCAGGDVKEMASGNVATPEQRLQRMRAWHPLIRSLDALDRPVIGAVDGVAFGAGFGLALLVDLIIASERAVFSAAFQRMGLVPDFGISYMLPRTVGLPRARELLYSARRVDAAEAVRIGLALQAVPDEQLAQRAMAIAEALAGASQTGFGLTKRLLGATLQSDLGTMLEMESSAQSVAVTSTYAAEAAAAFAEKRPGPFEWPVRQGACAPPVGGSDSCNIHRRQP